MDINYISKFEVMRNITVILFFVLLVSCEVKNNLNVKLIPNAPCSDNEKIWITRKSADNIIDWTFIPFSCYSIKNDTLNISFHFNNDRWLADTLVSFNYLIIQNKIEYLNHTAFQWPESSDYKGSFYEFNDLDITFDTLSDKKAKLRISAQLYSKVTDIEYVIEPQMIWCYRDSVFNVNEYRDITELGKSKRFFKGASDSKLLKRYFLESVKLEPNKVQYYEIDFVNEEIKDSLFFAFEGGAYTNNNNFNYQFIIPSLEGEDTLKFKCNNDLGQYFGNKMLLKRKDINKIKIGFINNARESLKFNYPELSIYKMSSANESLNEKGGDLSKND